MKPSKRIFDILGALLLFLISLPLWILLAIVIKIDSKGPVLFKQIRIGKNGRYFTIFKFRTLYVHSPPYFRKPSISKDPRITRVGRLLRDLGLDELPQLINVLKGEMSLVGPRPEMPFIVENYSPLAKRRLEVLPGITGLWQILAPKNEPIHQHLKYDLYYIQQHSIKLDLWVLLKTLRILLGSRIGFKYENHSSVFVKELSDVWSKR